MSRTSGIRTAMLGVLVAVLAGCGGDGGDGGGDGQGARPGDRARGPGLTREPGAGARPAVTIGARNFAEQFVLGEIYAQGLEAAGFRVRRRFDLGSEQVALRALRRGRVDAYPEYTGAALTAFCGVAARDLPRDPVAAHRDVRACLARDGLTVLDATPFSASTAFAMTRSRAEELGVRRLSDLQDSARDLRLSGPPACRRSPDCAPGLRRVYGLRFRAFEAAGLDRRHDVLTRGRADVGLVFATDGQIRARDLRLLEDDRRLLPPYNVALVLRDGALARAGPGLRRVVEQVQRGLTTTVMQGLNARVELEGQRPEAVAGAYLRRSGLVR